MKTPNDIKPVIALVADAIDKRKDLTIARLQAELEQAPLHVKDHLEAELDLSKLKVRASGPAPYAIAVIIISIVAYCLLH